MRQRQWLQSVALLVVLILPIGTASSAPAPWPKPARQPPARAMIVQAFDHLRLGMTDEEVRVLLAPFQKVHTGHGQWPCWREGRFEVSLTFDILGAVLRGEAMRVVEAELVEKRVEVGKTRTRMIKRLGK